MAPAAFAQGEGKQKQPLEEGSVPVSGRWAQPPATSALELYPKWVRNSPLCGLRAPGVTWPFFNSWCEDDKMTGGG